MANFIHLDAAVKSEAASQLDPMATVMYGDVVGRLVAESVRVRVG